MESSGEGGAMDLTTDKPAALQEQLTDDLTRSARDTELAQTSSKSPDIPPLDLPESSKSKDSASVPMDVDKNDASTTLSQPTAEESGTSSDLAHSLQSSNQVGSSQGKNSSSEPAESSGKSSNEGGKAKPASFLASLFTGAQSTSEKRSTPTEMDTKPSTSPVPTTSDLLKEEQKIKQEMIEDVEMKTAEDRSAIGKVEPDQKSPTDEVVKRASPRLQQLAAENSSKEAAATEKMDCETAPLSREVPPISASPKTVPEAKNTGKQLPIPGKTMRQRKTSNASPNGSEPKKVQRNKSALSPSSKPKKKPPVISDDNQDGRNDFYCWVCHKEGEVLCCELCPRVFHAKCLDMTEEPEGDWFCPECEKITNAECKETQSRAMSMLTTDQFSLLLKHVIQRMKIPMSEPFHEPVDTKMFMDYRDYVFHPMDLSTIEKNVKKKKYGCPEAFISEFKWVIHNCIIYNSLQSKLTQTARSMLKVAERELTEMELCPECYLNSCSKRENWFCEPCKELHPLVFAKLQGFPHWPAKALRIEKGMVDVRFFGQHDRAWIALSGCYLISKDMPLPAKNKKKSKGPGAKGGLEEAMQEMQVYIENVKKMTGEFEYAPPRTLLTHIDLYRKPGTAKAAQATKRLGQNEAKTSGQLVKSDQLGSKAKAETKGITVTGKGLIKPRGIESFSQKKTKTVTTSGEHPTRLFATKKKRASMEFLSKTIESCKASCGIDTIQDIKMTSPSDETTSSSEDDDSSEGKEKVTVTAALSGGAKSDKPTTSATKTADEDDSDAELVIDLGDMDESTDATNEKKSSGGSSAKSGILKKYKTDDIADKPSTSKSPLKSALHNPSRPEKEERKKMLAKALSEKIGSKRKQDHESLSSFGSSKTRKIQEGQEKRDNSQPDVGSKMAKLKDKEWKKSSQIMKDLTVKIKPGLVKGTGDSSFTQKKDGFNDRRLSDQYKHKSKDGAHKSILKKPVQQDKPARIVQIPTEADTRKLFNGGRIPRKNPASNISDEEAEKKDGQSFVDPNLGHNPRLRGTENADSNSRLNPNRQAGFHKSSVIEKQRKTSADDNIALASLKKYSDKVMDTVQKVFYEMYTDMMVPLTATAGSEAATPAAATAMHDVAQLRLELQRLKWMHEQEVAEVKHNHDLAIAEIRESLEHEKKQMLLEAKVQADAEKKSAIEETKRKQWCAYCNKEAIFYCCWNTSYCDYPCQQKHWPQHMNSCSQARDSSSQLSASEKRIDAATTSPQTKLSLRTPNANSTQSTKSITSFAVSAPAKISVKVPISTSQSSKPSTEGKYIGSSITPVAVDKVPRKTSTTESVKLQKQAPLQTTVTAQKSSSGSAISAIGARLLAEKQRSNTSDEKLSFLAAAKVTDAATSPSLSIAPVKPASMEDHVKVTMESPLSPDAMPHSPAKTTKDKIDPIIPITSQSLSAQNIDTEKNTKIVTSQIETKQTAAGMTKIIDSGAISKPSTLVSKSALFPPSTTLSSVEDNDTRMASESSSLPDMSRSKLESPSRSKPLNTGSSLTKVATEDPVKNKSDGENAIEHASDASPVKIGDTPPVLESIDKATVEPSKSSESEVDTLGSQVVTESYPVNPQNTVPTKTAASPTLPMEVSGPDTVQEVSSLAKHDVPSFDKDKSAMSEPKISDSVEPMETDSKS